MAINGAYNYNNYNTKNYNARTSYASREQHEEYAREQAFLKEHGLDGDLVEKGRLIDAMNRRTDSAMSNAYNYESHKTVSIPIDGEHGAYRIVSTDTEEGKAHLANLIEERDKAVAEFAKYRDLVNQTAKERAGGTWTYDDADKYAYAHQIPDDKSTAAAEKSAKAGEHGNGRLSFRGRGKYDTASFDMDKIREVKSDMKGNIGAYKQMVFNQAKTQAGYADTTLGAMLKGVADMSPADAAKAISEDGEWGVNATANRILDFAKALSGGDPSKIKVLRDAVNKGFAAASKIWGGGLPGICHDTLSQVMKGFDEWEKTGDGSYSS